MEVLAVAFMTVPFVAVVMLALLVAFIAIGVVSRPGIACLLFVLLCVQNTLAPNMGGLPVGITLYFGDLVCPLLGAAGLIRLASRQNTGHAMPRSFWLFVAVLLVSFFSGVLKYGTSAGVAFRPYFYALSIALYFGSVPFDAQMMRLFVRTQIVLAAFLIVVIILRWTGALPSASDGEAATAQFGLLDRIRVITAAPALLLLQLALLLTMGRERGTRSAISASASLLLLAFVLVLQHRSVWLAGMAALGASMLLHRKLSIAAAIWVGLGLLFILGLFQTLNVGNPVLHEIARSADRAVQGADSTQARFDSWTFAVDKWWAGGPQAWLLGLPFGTDMERFVISSGGSLEKVDFQAHNFYVQTLFNTGLLGLTAFVCLAVRIARDLRAKSLATGGTTAPAVFFMLFVSQLVFYVTYGTSFEHGMLLGTCLSLAACTTAGANPDEAPLEAALRATPDHVN